MQKDIIYHLIAYGQVQKVNISPPILEKPSNRNLQGFRILCSELCGSGKVAGSAPSPITYDHPYRFSIHLVASESLIFPRYRCVVERFECRRITLLTISMGTPDLDAYVAACLLRS